MLLTQRLVDELIYGEKGNEVVLVKYLEFIGAAHGLTNDHQPTLGQEN